MDRHSLSGFAMTVLSSLRAQRGNPHFFYEIQNIQPKK
jgi:hypothetical protein